MSIITVERKVLEKNDQIAAEIRNLFYGKKIFSFNLLSSPGSGKTSFIEQSVKKITNDMKIGVIEGDVQTDLDAQRIDRLGIRVAQIITNGACHLDASLIKNALMNFDLKDLKLLIIENVGNLVCPAGYDLGEDFKVVMLSVNEGEEKPLKYPNVFRNSKALIINKIDLVPYLDFSMEKLETNALIINPKLKIFKVSSKTGEGIGEFNNWLIEKINSKWKSE